MTTISGAASRTSDGLPTGPDLPARQVAKLWIEQPVELWQACAAQYGDVFTIELGSLGKVVLFSHPEAVRQIFQLPSSAYECQNYNEHYKIVMGANSLLVADGADHSRKRRLLMPALHRRTVEQHGDKIRQLARDTIASWPADRAFSPRASIHMMVLKLILRISLGSADSGLGKEVTEIFAREIYRDLTSWGPWTRFSELQPQFRGMIAEEIRRRRGRGDAGASTLLDAMLQARDESGNLLDDEEIQDHLFTMVVGGVDPTALAISWLLYWSHQDPAVLGRLRGELAKIGPDPEPRAVGELPYLGAVCQESLRMFPVVITPTGRKLLAPAEVHGRLYPAGVSLVPCTYLVHHRADLYPDPGQFRPERFLGKTYAAHEYFPFGGGARTCIGASLAPLEMKLVLAEVVTRCELEPAHTGEVRPVRHGTLLAPSDAMKFVVSSRKNDEEAHS